VSVYFKPSENKTSIDLSKIPVKIFPKFMKKQLKD
jgi:hypothetical protein